MTARLRRVLRSVPARCATTCARIAVEPLPALWNWNFRGPFGVNLTVCGDWPGQHQEQIRAYLDAQHRKMVDEMTEYMMRPPSPWDAPQSVIPRIPPPIVPDPGIPPGKAYQVVATGVIYANPEDIMGADPNQIAAKLYPGEWVLFSKRLPCGHCSSLEKAYELARQFEAEHGRRPLIVAPGTVSSGPPLLRGVATRFRRPRPQED